MAVTSSRAPCCGPPGRPSGTCSGLASCTSSWRRNRTGLLPAARRIDRSGRRAGTAARPSAVCASCRESYARQRGTGPLLLDARWFAETGLRRPRGWREEIPTFGSRLPTVQCPREILSDKPADLMRAPVGREQSATSSHVALSQLVLDGLAGLGRGCAGLHGRRRRMLAPTLGRAVAVTVIDGSFRRGRWSVNGSVRQGRTVAQSLRER